MKKILMFLPFMLGLSMYINASTDYPVAPANLIISVTNQTASKTPVLWGIVGDTSNFLNVTVGAGETKTIALPANFKAKSIRVIYYAVDGKTKADATEYSMDIDIKRADGSYRFDTNSFIYNIYVYGDATKPRGQTYTLNNKIYPSRCFVGWFKDIDMKLYTDAIVASQSDVVKKLFKIFYSNPSNAANSQDVLDSFGA
jgi:hypothetical protein